MRNVRIARACRGSPYPQTSRPRKRRKRTTTLGQDHGCSPEKDLSCLPSLPSGYPYKTASTTEKLEMNERRAACIERCTCSSAGGQWKRAFMYLASGLPNRATAKLACPSLGNGASEGS